MDKISKFRHSCLGLEGNPQDIQPQYTLNQLIDLLDSHNSIDGNPKPINEFIKLLEIDQYACGTTADEVKIEDDTDETIQSPEPYETIEIDQRTTVANLVCILFL